MRLAQSQYKRASGPLIVVVDDSPTVRKIVQTILEREDYEVLGFADGPELFRWLVGPDARPPAVLILDIGLPYIDGYELAMRLKKKPLFAQTVMMMLSRRYGMIDKLKGYLAGAKIYLTKPMRTQDLLAAVAFCLGRGVQTSASLENSSPPQEDSRNVGKRRLP
ncbi:MAG: response regulator [Ktedonobacteraceae bacterium]|nr:response regulator [Ktedonobacteraceae bacterium]